MDVLSEYTAAAGGEPSVASSPLPVPPQLRNPKGRPLGAERSFEEVAAAEFGSIIEPDNSSEAIKGRPPHYEIKYERGEHRVICFLKAQGHSNVEIAKLTGFTPVMISNVLRQPRSLQLIADEIAKAGRSEVEVLLQGATADAVQTLIDIIPGGDGIKTSDRIAAANSLIDRVLGKPKQSLDLTTTKAAEKLTDDELAAAVSRGQKN